MIITCPRCSTKFSLPDDQASPLRKAKCSFCGNIFVLADGMDDKAFDTVSMINQTQEDVPSSSSAEDTVNSILNDDDGFNVDSIKPKKRGKLLPIIVGLILLLILAAGALIYTGIIKLGSAPEDVQDPSSTPVAEQPEGNSTSQNATSIVPPDDAHVKDIIFQDTKQYFVNNEKLGQIFVVEGKAVNNYKFPKELIQVEASLLDEHNVVVATKQQFCGVTLTMFQLQVLSEADMEKALNNNIEILANNLNIQPGGAVAFMVVFVNPPPNISTLFLRIVDAKDSPTN